MSSVEEELAEAQTVVKESWTREELQSARSKAQARAKTQLVHENRDRYRELYYRELKREGLEVVLESRVGSARAAVRARELAGIEVVGLPYEPVDPERFDEPEGLSGLD